MPDREGKQNDTRLRPLRRFEELTPAEVFALAIHIERANTRRFRAFAQAFRGYDEEVARRFEELALQAEPAAQAFYLRAAAACQDPHLARFYQDFAQMEGDHVAWFEQKIRPATAAGEKA